MESIKKIVINPLKQTLDIYEDGHILKTGVDFSKGLVLEFKFRGFLTKTKDLSSPTIEVPLIQYVDIEKNQLVIKEIDTEVEYRLTLPPHVIKLIQQNLLKL